MTQVIPFYVALDEIYTFVSICLDPVFFFSLSTTAHVSGGQISLFMNNSHIYLTFQPLFITLVGPCTVHGTHKLHFSVTFSLKIDPMVLFIYI